ncbi:hypothetical protein IW144_002375 [Coemansia sp. RSA 522]|nr:hypothetical protein IW144_002375 [Coemansia sp. RSA 522]
MPEPYQLSSSPEERSLLEEHISRNTAHEKSLKRPAASTSASVPAVIPVGNTDGSPQQYVKSDMHQIPAPRVHTQTPPTHMSSSAGVRVPPRSTLPNASAIDSTRHESYSAAQFAFTPASEHARPADIAVQPSTGRSRPYRRHFSNTHPYSSQSAGPYNYEGQSQPERHSAHQQALQQQNQNFVYTRHAGFSPQHMGAVPLSAHHPHPMPISPYTPPQHMGHHFVVRSAMLPSHPAAHADHMATHFSRRFLSAEEKELRRKVSHSAIEKRRRERTNAVLCSLQDMVPGLPKSGKIQKLEILEAAAEYIRRLKLASNGAKSVHEQDSSSKDKQSDGPFGNMHHLNHHLQQERRDSCSNTTETQEPDNSTGIEYADNLDPQSGDIDSSASMSSDTSKEGSGEDTLANPGDHSDASRSSPSADPSAMEVKFLLC